MTTSDAIDQLATALAAAQGEMENAVKDAENPFFSRPNRKASYADLASCWDACRGPLTKQGLSVVQFPRVTFQGTPEPYEWVAKSSGETRYGVRVITVVSVLTRIMHASGQWLEDEMSTVLPMGDPQAVGSATSYLRRYALMSVVGIATEDDDAEAAHSRSNGSSKPKSFAPAPPAATPKGYSEWIADMRAVADEGTDALMAAWKTSALDHRRHLTTNQPQLWENLKTTAATVTAKLGGKSVSA